MPEYRTLLKAPNPPPMSALANSLLSELDRIDQPFIIALDDYHLINEAAVHDLIAAMLKHPLLTMHLVIVSRRDPPAMITRLHAKSQVTEIRAHDLRFTKAETKMFLEQLLGSPINPSTAAAVRKNPRAGRPVCAWPPFPCVSGVIWIPRCSRGRWTPNT